MSKYIQDKDYIYYPRYKHSKKQTQHYGVRSS